jgi:hypothetical protein
VDNRALLTWAGLRELLVELELNPVAGIEIDTAGKCLDCGDDSAREVIDWWRTI